MRAALAACLYLFAIVSTPPLAAQGVAVRGVVWQPPEDYTAAAADLRKIRETGFNAVRTGIVQDERLLDLADRLGLAVYQELPLRYLSSERLVDTLSFAQELLQNVVRRSARYASARDFGIARYADTTDSTSCEALRELVDAGRRAAPSSARFYYTSIFARHDACSDVVDYVLLDGRDHVAPARLIRTWYDVHETPAGLAGVGTWVRSSGPGGLRNERSPQQQARFLENRLTELVLDRAAPGLTALFVYRWRDAEISLPLLSRADPDPFRATYGLHASQMNERPSYEVARGILTGSQTTFAFEAGEVTLRDWPWITILGWVALLLIALLYAFSPRLRQMVPRYFRAHGFYRDAIREGRDLLLGSSLIVLLALGLAAGVTVAVGVDILGEVMAFRILLSWLPEPFVFFLARATVEPWLFAFLIAAIYAGLILIWIILMMILSRTRYTLGPGQVLMLVVWPRWPLLVLMLAALALAGSPPPEDALLHVYILGGIAGLWVLVTLHAIVRAVVDYTAIARVPPYVPILLFLLNPVVISLTVAAFAWLQYRDDVMFAVRALLYS